MMDLHSGGTDLMRMRFDGSGSSVEVGSAWVVMMKLESGYELAKVEDGKFGVGEMPVVYFLEEGT